MTIMPHLLAGSALATATTTSLPLAFLIGFFLHFVIDAIPHVDPGTFFNPERDENKLPRSKLTRYSLRKSLFLNRSYPRSKLLGIRPLKNKPWPTWIYIYAVSEFIVIWVLVILLFKNSSHFGIIMMGGLGGIFVDILDNNPFRFLRQWPLLKQIHRVHKGAHYDLPAQKWYWGILTQLIILGASLWYLLKF